MKQEVMYKITGVAPLLMHNGQLADPMNQFAKSIKKISSKRDKTEADLEEMARLEWYGSLYIAHGKPCIPGEILEATLSTAARKRKRGQQAKAGLICPENAELHYDGPKSIDELWDDERFRLVKGVRVQRNTVMRTRPIFPEWHATVLIWFNDEVLNPQEIDTFLQIAGELIGLMEWRPRFGRFMAEKL